MWVCWPRQAVGGTSVCVGDGGKGVCVGVGEGCTSDTVVGLLVGAEVTSRHALTKLARAPSVSPTNLRREMGRIESCSLSIGSVLKYTSRNHQCGTALVVATLVVTAC